MWYWVICVLNIKGLGIICWSQKYLMEFSNKVNSCTFTESVQNEWIYLLFSFNSNLIPACLCFHFTFHSITFDIWRNEWKRTHLIPLLTKKNLLPCHELMTSRQLLKDKLQGSIKKVRLLIFGSADVMKKPPNIPSPYFGGYNVIILTRYIDNNQRKSKWMNFQ